MEASSLTTSAATSGVLPQRMPLLRLQADERLIALMREGHDRAFEVLFNRYQSRLLAFCRRLVGSPQDAEDVLQEVFAAAHAAILADSRPINARPWLYRIARNRCVNHLRKPPTADGVDSMDVHPHENGTSTLERVQRREELRAIVARVHELPETQRTALALRAIDDLSYADIAQAMGTTLPSVKSLVVRARMSLAGARGTRWALAPFGLLTLLRKLIPAKLGGSSGVGGTAGTAGSVSSAGGAAGTAGGVAATAGGAAGTAGSVAAAGSSSITLGGVVSAANTAATGLGGALGAKAAVGVAAAAVFTAGAVSVDKMNLDSHHATARADRAGVSAVAGTASGIGSSATSPSAGLRSAANTAGAAGSTARRARGVGRGSTTGRPHAKPAHPAKPAAGSGQIVQAGSGQIEQASTAARELPITPGTSKPGGSKGISASLKPPKIKSVVPPSLGSSGTRTALPPQRPLTPRARRVVG